MSLISSIFVLLVAAYGLGRVCLLLKQPPVAGHMIAGIVLGPSVLSWVDPNDQLGAISNLSVLLVVLTAGLEMRLQDVAANMVGRKAIASIVAFVLPAAGGAAVAAAFSLPPIPMLVVAMCVAVTALPVALQILTMFSMLKSRIATVSISGALLSDIIVFAGLGVLGELSSLQHSQSIVMSIAWAIARMVGLLILVTVAHFICVRLMRKLAGGAQSSDRAAVNLAFSILFVLALAAASELLGFHFAIGAFFAAMMITPEIIGTNSFEKLSGTCETLTAALFGPLFLAYQGMQFHLQSLAATGFLIALIAVAVVSKLLAGYIAGRLQTMSKHDSLGVGIVMNARGVMELVVASIAFHAGLIDAGIFSALLLVGLATTALTPLMLQRWRASPSAVEHRSQASR